VSSRADRLAARFAELAAPVTVDTADGPQQTVRNLHHDEVPRKAAGWDATHKRVTYWMHLAVIAAVREAAERNGESVAAFVDRSLRRELQRSDERGEGPPNRAAGGQSAAVSRT
jgi:hypothetical protein